METQLKIVTKEEAHKLIEEAPGDSVLVLTYNKKIGMSDTGKYIKKKKGRMLVDRSSVLVLAESKPIMTLNLHDKYFSGFSCYNREEIDRTIM